MGTLKAFFDVIYISCVVGGQVCADKKVNRNGTSSTMEYESLE